MRRLLSALAVTTVLATLCALRAGAQRVAAAATPSGIAKLTVQFAETSPLDTGTHIDLRLGQKRKVWALVQDRSDRPLRATVLWTSSDAAIAHIERGTDSSIYVVPTGVGVAQLTASTAGPGGPGQLSVSVPVCVSPDSMHVIQFVAGGAYVAAPGSRKDARVQLRPIDHAYRQVDWTPCVHWYVLPQQGSSILPDPKELSISHTGLLSFPHSYTSYNLGAAVGTAYPIVIPPTPKTKKA